MKIFEKKLGMFFILGLVMSPSWSVSAEFLSQAHTVLVEESDSEEEILPSARLVRTAEEAELGNISPPPSRRRLNAESGMSETYQTLTLQRLYGLSNQLNISRNIAIPMIRASIRSIENAIQDPSLFHASCHMLHTLVFPELQQYIRNHPEEKAVLNVVWEHLNTIRPFENGNLIHLWNLLKEIHPLSHQNAMAAFHTFTDIDLGQIYRYSNFSHWNEAHELKNANNALFYSALTHGEDLETLLEDIPEQHLNSSTYMLGKYYAHRYPVFNETPNVLNNPTPFLSKVAQMMRLEKIRQALLRKDKIEYHLSLLIQEITEIPNR